MSKIINPNEPPVNNNEMLYTTVAQVRMLTQHLVLLQQQMQGAAKVMEALAEKANVDIEKLLSEGEVDSDKD